MKAPHSDRGREPTRKAWEAEVLVRMRAAAGDRMFSTLAQLTGCNSETVRRYLRRGKPSAYFMSRLCSSLNVSPEWLLMGTGPMHRQRERMEGQAIESKPRQRGSNNGQDNGQDCGQDCGQDHGSAPAAASAGTERNLAD